MQTNFACVFAYIKSAEPLQCRKIYVIIETENLPYHKKSPEFARLNDDVLFGEVWSSDGLSLKMRSILTVTVLGRAQYGVREVFHRQFLFKTAHRSQADGAHGERYVRAAVSQ